MRGAARCRVVEQHRAACRPGCIVVDPERGNYRQLLERNGIIYHRRLTMGILNLIIHGLCAVTGTQRKIRGNGISLPCGVRKTCRFACHVVRGAARRRVIKSYRAACRLGRTVVNLK